MKVAVVMPTYNEAENIKRMVDSLSEIFLRMPEHAFKLLVVDDSSPDGTAQKVEEMQKKYDFLHLLVRKEKTGLGAAYVDGFRYAMDKLGADIVVEMDADFQHDPNDVPKLVKEIDNGYDYVIGSRFAKGGSIPASWAFYRKFLSWGGNLFSKIVLGVFSINDFTSGFKASRVKGFVDQLDLDNIRSEGFAYKIDLLYKMHKLGAKTKEVPIAFGLRDRGDSKMERNNFMDSLRVVLTIRYNEAKSFFRFIVVGFAGLFVDLGLFNILRLGVLSSDYASAVSGFVAMTVTYVLNNVWSFNDKKITKLTETIKSMVIYYISSYIPILFRSWLIGVVNSKFGDNFVISNIAFGLGITIGLIWNFTVYSKVIWNKNKKKT